MRRAPQLYRSHTLYEGGREGVAVPHEVGRRPLRNLQLGVILQLGHGF